MNRAEQFAFEKPRAKRFLPERKYNGLKLEYTVDLRPFFDTNDYGENFNELRVYDVTDTSDIEKIILDADGELDRSYEGSLNWIQGVTKVAFVDGKYTCCKLPYQQELWMRADGNMVKHIYLGAHVHDYSGDFLEKIVKRCENSTIKENEYWGEFAWSEAEPDSIIGITCYIDDRPDAEVDSIITYPLRTTRGNIVFKRDGKYEPSTLIISMSESGTLYVSYYKSTKTIEKAFDENGRETQDDYLD